MINVCPFYIAFVHVLHYHFKRVNQQYIMYKSIFPWKKSYFIVLILIYYYILFGLFYDDSILIIYNDFVQVNNLNFDLSKILTKIKVRYKNQKNVFTYVINICV